MDVGMLVIFQNYLGEGSDTDTVRGEMLLADLVEPLGYDKLWVAEHHFTDYSAIADNIQYLSYVAGRTEKIGLATGAVILPWNDPIRVAEREHHGSEAPGFLCGDLIFCHRDAEKAEELAMQYMTNYFLTIIQHYELMSGHFDTVKGYDHYASSAELFKQAGMEVAATTYCSVQCWGTPEQILEKLRWRRDLLGDFELNAIVNYGSMPQGLMEESVTLFAEEVLPELHRW